MICYDPHPKRIVARGTKNPAAREVADAGAAGPWRECDDIL